MGLTRTSVHSTICGRRYIQRRAREGFHDAAKLTDPSAVKSLLELGRQELEVVKRQSLVYGLYGRKFKNVLVRGAGAASSLWSRRLLGLAWACGRLGVVEVGSCGGVAGVGVPPAEPRTVKVAGRASRWPSPTVERLTALPSAVSPHHDRMTWLPPTCLLDPSTAPACPEAKCPPAPLPSRLAPLMPLLRPALPPPQPTHPPYRSWTCRRSSPQASPPPPPASERELAECWLGT